jgi:DNA polymerase elongation subunit (family B)
MNRLYFDIETSPCLGWFWRPGYNLNINPGNVLEHARIICICYKWEGKKTVYSLSWDNNKCDKQMLIDFVKVLDSADEIVGHNSDKFDIKWIRTRCLFHNIPMMPEYTSLDTLKEARKGFLFPSNRLDAIGKYTGVGKKIKTTEDLWIDAWYKSSKKALRQMVTYCKQDVVLLEDVHQKLKPYTKAKNRFFADITQCPNCGSERLGVNAYKITSAGARYVQLQCKDCGVYSKVNDKRYQKLSK